MNKALHLMVLIFLLAGCSSSPTPPASGVEGQVLIGPMCPVVQVGNPCPDQAYQATLTILDLNGKKLARFQTEADGTFHYAIAPGQYVLHPESPATFPHAPEQTFTVQQGQYTRLTVTYDSGIR
jgi:hypothetical protein